MRKNHLFKITVALLGLSAIQTGWAANTEKAIFAGGCFWCMEEAFEKLPGVKDAVSGYSNGNVPDPDYRSVSNGGTGHAEVIEVEYDPTQISYAQLVDNFWINIDPTAKDRQFCDAGSQYRSGIFYMNDAQKEVALASLKAQQDTGKFKQIYTEVEPAGTFYMAEAYHQDYYKKNPLRYHYYKASCGRVNRLEEIWGKKK